MKITFLTPNLEMHGGNLVMIKYANFLMNMGHEITIISSDKKTLSNIDSRINLLLYKSFPIKYVDFFLLQKIYYPKIINLIEECDFLIPIYTPLLPAVIKAKKRKKLKAKIIFLFQDFFEMVWAGPWIKKTLSNVNITKNISMAVCVSKSSEKALKSVSGIKSIVIPNGIDQDFHIRKIQRDNYLLFVGRPQKPKGFHVFMQAYKIVKKTFPDLKARVVTPTVQDKVVDGIEFVKYRNRKQLAEIYNKALIYVNTSLGESFGLPALEAMASGTPVVLTDTVGAREYANDSINCIVTSIGNAEETASAIKKLLSNPEFSRGIVKNGLVTAGKYSWTESLEKFNLLLKSIKERDS